MNVEVWTPTKSWLTLQSYPGVDPAFTGVAVKITDPPEQTGLALAAIETLTGRTGFTVMVTVFDMAGLPVTQVSEEVISQVTASPLTGM